MLTAFVAVIKINQGMFCGIWRNGDDIVIAPAIASTLEGPNSTHVGTGAEGGRCVRNSVEIEGSYSTEMEVVLNPEGVDAD